MTNTLYFGDNLTVMRDYIKPQSVDLIYLDPPFNSKRNYNIFFDSTENKAENAQVMVFEDFFYWNDETNKTYEDLKTQGPARLFELISGLVSVFGRNSQTTAYLVMMAARLKEINRILKPTGSLYLHCDPAAGHYIKLVLDCIFDEKNFRNHITWKRTSAHNDAKHWGHISDIIFFYTKSDAYTWNKVYTKYSKEYIDNFYRYKDKDGRIFRVGDLTAAGVSKGESGRPWRGVDPTKNDRHWAVNREFLNDPDIPASPLAALDYLDSAGRIYWPEKGIVPGFKRYLDEMPGAPVQEVITDIPPLSANAKEKLGYPTQKPLALLERILAASSNAGDVVFDPFCGCGTTIVAAQKMERQWLGIDASYLAVNLVEKRLKDVARLAEWQVIGAPIDLKSAQNLADRDKYQFQYWACALIEARPYNDRIKGSDRGIDGKIFFSDDQRNVKKEKQIIVSIKGGKNVGVDMIRDLRGTIARENAAIGVFVTLTRPTRPMIDEAHSAGCYCSPDGAKYPKIQILTIEKLLNGQKVTKPIDLTYGAATFKKARPSAVRYQDDLFRQARNS
ncbi:MAG: restriction endonuclease [Deltaproteobacteria bacterium]|jgi:site-specific DNA-methyltransferase (adenine-specific)|nr:restriction endonuclease [Deltaproteobacteria bacterium]